MKTIYKNIYIYIKCTIFKMHFFYTLDVVQILNFIFLKRLKDIFVSFVTIICIFIFYAINLNVINLFTKSSFFILVILNYINFN